MGYRAAMFDTAQVHKFISMRRNKTDLNDARGIAELSRFGRSILTEVFVKSTDCYAVRNNIVARNSVMKQRIATEGMMRSLLRLHGGRISVRIINAKLLRRHFENASRLVLEETGVDISASILPLISLAERIRAEIDRLDGEINAFAESNEVCRHFMEIPGVRALTAVSFYTAIEDPSRFRRSTDVSAYLGLTPKIHRSGENTRPNGISKAGNVMTRTHLVTAATVLLSVCKKEFELRRWGLDRAGVIGLPKARIAVARKLANMMFSMWRANARFEPWGPSGKNALIVPCGAIDGPQQDSVGQYRANDPALM